jgi:hypothetical protein
MYSATIVRTFIALSIGQLFSIILVVWTRKSLVLMHPWQAPMATQARGDLAYIDFHKSSEGEAREYYIASCSALPQRHRNTGQRDRKRPGAVS